MVTNPANAQPSVQARASTSDEALVAGLAVGDLDALRHLHQRHAPLVFSVAARVVDEAAAEDVVQEVFLTLWKKHESYDPARGTFRGWIAQVARRRALNHRRGRGRPTESDESLADVPEDAVAPDEARWLAHRRAVLRAAVEALPPHLRQAVSLAFFEELTHEQVAAALHTPLGTAKTRIRQALKRLGPAVAVLLALATLVFIWRRDDERQARDERALWLVTASDVVPLHLVAAPGVPPEAHGSYRARSGATVAVLTASHLPPLSAGETYVGWIRRGDRWRSLGELTANDHEERRMVVADMGNDPPATDGLRVTREARGAISANPAGPTVLQWEAAAGPR